VGKVVKGHYLTLGASTLSSPSLNSNVVLVNAGKKVRVIAQCVKFKDGKKVVPVGPKFAIPESYEGFFEILSEDGRSVRCIESVSDLARRYPDSVLVRENMKAYVSKSDDIETIQEKSRTINVGEVLILVGEVLGVRGKTQTRFLRCFDQEGENVYLPYETKGKFSAIAKEENISGVHNIRNLQKKRLPLMVRLAHGTSPVGLKAAQQFLPELRLLQRVEEDALVALPLTKESSVISLPSAAVLKLQPSLNHDYVTGMKELERLVERALSQMAELADRILVHDVSSGRDSDDRHKSSTNHQGSPARKSSLPHSDLHQRGSIYGLMANRGSDGGKGDDYDEIDQIYDYVRGFAPLPKSAKGWQYFAEKAENPGQKEALYQKLASPAQPSSDVENKPPDPPPIETIPGRKASPMDLTPPMTPPFSPPWSPAHEGGTGLMAPLGPNGQMIGIVPPPHLVMERPHSAVPSKIYEKLGESKKRQRPKTAEPTGKNGRATAEVPPTRFVKAQTKASSNSKHKFFRSRKEKERDNVPPPMGSLSASTHQLHKESVKATSQPSFFNMRYKSLTNLAHQEYDTLDSSNSGGKTSFDSAGSRHVPEKRSRKLSRPKSLTNLVWDLRGGGGGGGGGGMQRSSSKPSLLIHQDATVPGLGNNKGAGKGLKGARKSHSSKMATLYL